jgi:hypothetical protein
MALHTQTPNSDFYDLIVQVLDLNDVSLTPSNKKYTFYEPNWVFSQTMLKFLKNKYPTTFDVETMFLTAPFNDIMTGAVQDMQYWIDRGYIRWYSSTGPGGQIDSQEGYLPSEFYDNTFSLSNIKLTENTFNIPTFKPVFFIVNNIKGKTDAIWTLTNVTDPNNNFTVISTKGAPYFIYRFQDVGVYSLSVQVFDNNDNSFTAAIPNLINVLGPSDYVSLIESQLNARKVQLTK